MVERSAWRGTNVSAGICRLAAGLAMGLCGCQTGSLATSTGDRSAGAWSIAPRQDVHIGETVELSFMLTKPMQAEPMSAFGLADYCMFTVGPQRIDADIDDRGGFRARCTIADHAPGDRVKVTAAAYRKEDARDQMQIAGEWITNTSPRNAPDVLVASASLWLDVYQSHVRFDLPPNPDGYDLSTAVMILRKADDSRSMVFEERPLRRGFMFIPQPTGGWWVDYAPTGDQVNPCGVTDVEFSVYDRAGNRHVRNIRIATP